jgi:hypothetical protein
MRKITVKQEIDLNLKIDVNATFNLPGLSFIALWEIWFSLEYDESDTPNLVREIHLSEYTRIIIFGKEIPDYRTFSLIRTELLKSGIAIQEVMDKATDKFEETEFTNEKFSWALNLLRTKQTFTYEQETQN